MRDFKISIITVAYNAEKTIERCIRSVIGQDYNNLEYIIIDGASSDCTLKIANEYRERINLIISEPDKGIYDAMNKGIALAAGDIIGMLNADDYFPGANILSQTANKFKTENAGIVYGDLDYVGPKGNSIRKWRSGEYNYKRFNRGWMPPHPAFYCKAALYKNFGLYRLDFGTAADYELMLRFMHLQQVKVSYLPVVMVKMQIGGASNKSIGNRVKVLMYDLKAMQINNIRYPLITLLLKPLRKIGQYL